MVQQIRRKGQMINIGKLRESNNQVLIEKPPLQCRLSHI